MTPICVSSIRDLSGEAKVLYGVLAMHAGKRNYCWPSEETLAEETGRSPKTVRKHLNELAAAKLIVKRRGGQGQTNTYTLLPLADDQDAAPPERNTVTEPDRDGRTIPLYRGEKIIVAADEDQAKLAQKVAGLGIPVERAEQIVQDHNRSLVAAVCVAAEREVQRKKRTGARQIDNMESWFRAALARPEKYQITRADGRWQPPPDAGGPPPVRTLEDATKDAQRTAEQVRQEDEQGSEGLRKCLAKLRAQRGAVA